MTPKTIPYTKFILEPTLYLKRKFGNLKIIKFLILSSKKKLH
jgi:hypothetical protein